MRVWDIHPGYLRRQNLLAEHREVHALLSVVSRGMRGYAHHPETLRWKDCLGGLAVRHGLLVEEMLLRGYRHSSPFPQESKACWPDAYIDEPADQYAILGRKYGGADSGRIPLPSDAQRLWAQHKYSILARDTSLYRRIGPMAAHRSSPETFSRLSRLLAEVLRMPPGAGGLMNALLHMWGYVSEPGTGARPVMEDPASLARTIQKRALRHNVRYLLESTALSDLAYWASRV